MVRVFTFRQLIEMIFISRKLSALLRVLNIYYSQQTILSVTIPSTALRVLQDPQKSLAQVKLCIVLAKELGGRDV
jgi:hypothetical protein